jgi:hypothetical protein
MSKVQWVATGSATDPCCCEEEPDCCMYPADELGDTFEAADLPDTLYGKWGDRADGTFTKSGSEYTLGTVTIRVNAGGTAWEFYDSDDDATSTIGNCLIRGDGNLTPGDDRVEDQFFDCYELIWSDDIPGNGPGSVALIRSGLCFWESEDQQWSLKMAVYEFFGDIGIYELRTPVGVCYETGSGSSPAGTYGSSYYFDLQLAPCP